MTATTESGMNKKPMPDARSSATFGPAALAAEALAAAPLPNAALPKAALPAPALPAAALPAPALALAAAAAFASFGLTKPAAMSWDTDEVTSGAIMAGGALARRAGAGRKPATAVNASAAARKAQRNTSFSMAV